MRVVTQRKLTLNRETLRNLQDVELRQVVGGVAVGAQVGNDLAVLLANQPDRDRLTQVPGHVISGGCCTGSSSIGDND